MSLGAFIGHACVAFLGGQQLIRGLKGMYDTGGEQMIKKVKNKAIQFAAKQQKKQGNALLF